MTEEEELEYLRLKAKAAGAAAPPSVDEGRKHSGKESFAVGAGSAATFGTLDELGGAIGKLILPSGRIEPGAAATEEMRAAADARPTNYELVRNRTRAAVKKAEADNPEEFAGGEVLGSLAGPVPAVGALRGARLLPRATNALARVAPKGKAASALARTVASGAAGGGAYGIGASEADLSDGGGAIVLDAAGGALAGAGGGVAGYGVSKAAPTLLRAVGQRLEKAGVNQARRVLQGGADIRSATKKPMSDEAAREALRSGAILPLGTTQGAARRLDRKAEHVGEVYGSIIDDLERHGVKGPNARSLADKMLAEADRLEPLVMDQTPVRALRKAAEDVLDKSELGERAGIAQTGRLGLAQAEALKRDLQAAAKAEYERLGGSKQAGKAKKAVAAAMREAIEGSVDEAGARAAPNSDVALLAESFRPVKGRLARLLEAKKFADSGASRAAQRNSLGLPERIAFMGTLATGNPGAALTGAGGVALGRSLLNRGASTMSVGAYGAGRAANLLGEALQMAPGRAAYGGAAGGAASRVAYDPEETEEQRRRRAVIEGLLGRR